MSDHHKGTLKITDTYLKDFATQKLQPFIDDLRTDPHRVELDGYAGTSTLGNDANWNYTQLLPGNAKGNLQSIGQLQASFKTFAAALSQKFGDISTAARTLQYDLKAVDLVITKDADKANITAAEMSADLAAVTFGGGGDTPPGNNPGDTPPGKNPGSNDPNDPGNKNS